MFPTGVGMDRPNPSSRPSLHRVPHGRGDGPHRWRLLAVPWWCSPRAWGWTVPRALWRRSGPVFPTGVGMDRAPGSPSLLRNCVPHGRGDGPTRGGHVFVPIVCSPRAWGWTVVHQFQRCVWCVFPTGVGMDRFGADPPGSSLRVPHGRGDGPKRLCFPSSSTGCSPRAWGWTGAWRRRAPSCGVFPTGVGMDRPPEVDHGQCTPEVDHGQCNRVPHGRGDGP